MLVVTGGAGFIGSNIVKGLNARGRTDILVVDDLTDGKKFKNLVDLQIQDYMDKDEFIEFVASDTNFDSDIEAVFHQGACSSTTEWDGKFMMQNNYDYSCVLLDYCLENFIPFLYASSAAVYGNNTVFDENPNNEKPLNVYGYSKLLFDQHVRRQLPTARSQVVGFRYFNVYGPREDHKGSMSSVAYHFNHQIQQQGKCRLFEGSDGYGPGEQVRDFVYVGDVVDTVLWFFQNPKKSGIFNLGTGRAQSFNDVAKAVIAWHGKGEMEYIPFPEHLKGHYQSFTQADLSQLRDAGFPGEFKTVEQGVKAYFDEYQKLK